MNGAKYPREWEQINDNTERLRLHGGWALHTYRHQIVMDKFFVNSEALEFIPDPKGLWVLEKE